MIDKTKLPQVAKPEMNAVHDEEADLVNALLSTVDNGDDNAVTKALEALLSHMQEHFDYEEGMLANRGFRMFDIHRSDHARIMGEEGAVAGVGFGFDLTHAHIQESLKRKGLPWERAKAFDGSAVFAPFVKTPADWENLGFRLWRNGTLAQEAHTERMIHKPRAILEEIRSFMSLRPGDIVMTGTPEGVASYEKGDTFRVELFDADGILLQKEWVVT